jgi:hypothetical protein
MVYHCHITLQPPEIDPSYHSGESYIVGFYLYCSSSCAHNVLCPHDGVLGNRVPIESETLVDDSQMSPGQSARRLAGLNPGAR